MKIKKSKELGFCSGVKRALEMVEKLSASAKEPIWTVGPLVHNPGVIAVLDKKGISSLKSIQNLNNHRGNMVIPTHGMGTKEIEAISSRGFPFYDSTCPIVGNLQQKVRKLSGEGYAIIIFGESEHPEVKGALGWVERGTANALATTDLPEVKKWATKVRRLALLCQTTQTISSYTKFCQGVLKTYLPEMLEIRILNTICPEVRKRQKATQELARTSDLMIIVGGKGSSNTRRLAEICQDAGAQVYQVEDAEEMKAEWLQNKRCIGIAAGTSTPIESVEEVETRLKELISNAER